MLAINIDEELVEAIGKAGFVQVGFGVESGDEEMRRRIRRVTRVPNLIQTIDHFRQKFPNIFIHCNFMLVCQKKMLGK